MNSATLLPRQDDGYEFGMDMTSLQDLITSALPLPRGLTGEFWSTYVARNEEMIYPLELFAALAIQSLGLSRYTWGVHGVDAEIAPMFY